MHNTSSSNPADHHARNGQGHSSSKDPGHLTFVTLGVSPYDSDASIEALVEYYHPFILSQAKSMAYIPRKLSHSADLYVDPDDVAQEVSIRFWKRLKKEPISNPEAYIKRMVHNEYIDAMRRCHINLQFLEVAENGELLEGEILQTPGEGMSDPAEEFERQLAANDFTERVAEAVSTLPPRQQCASANVLLKKVDNLLQVITAFKAHQLTFEAQEPEDEAERHRLQASFSPARLALAKELDVDLTLYKRSRR
jgi:RNA polymerase sigma factor (sigma-70 family)